METAVIYSCYFQNESQLGKYIPLINECFSDCDIFCGFTFNNSNIQEKVTELLGSRLLHSISNIIVSGVSDKEIMVNSDASGYQKALELLKNSDKKYDRYYFIHNKSVSRHEHLYQLFVNFCKNKNIFDKFLDSNTEYDGICDHYKICDRIKLPSGIPSFDFNMEKIETKLWLYVIGGRSMNNFIDDVQNEFFKTKLNIYFFEQWFPTIVDKYGYKRK